MNALQIAPDLDTVHPCRGVQLVVPMLTLSREEVEALQSNSAGAPRIVAWDSPEDEDSVDPFNNLDDSDTDDWEANFFEHMEMIRFQISSLPLPQPVRDDAAINRLLVGVPDAEGTCNVCLDALTEEAVETACGHHYHLRCVQPWLKSHNTCPVCRYELVRQDDIESILVATQ